MGVHQFADARDFFAGGCEVGDVIAVEGFVGDDGGHEFDHVLLDIFVFLWFCGHVLIRDVSSVQILQIRISNDNQERFIL